MTLKDHLNENDRFAASCGMQLTDIKEGYAKAQMTVEERHLNGGGVCQGGALFTLGDLAVAAAVNSHKQLTFGIQNNIVYLAKICSHARHSGKFAVFCIRCGTNNAQSAAVYIVYHVGENHVTFRQCLLIPRAAGCFVWSGNI